MPSTLYSVWLGKRFVGTWTMDWVGAITLRCEGYTVLQATESW